jgi:hypothetical protein
MHNNSTILPRLVLTSLMTAVLLSSCDRVHTYEYLMRNETADPVTIHFEVGEEEIDVMVLEQEQDLVYSYEQIRTKEIKDNRFDGLVSDVWLKQDSLTKAVAESEWIWCKAGPYMGSYTLVVDSLTFSD